MIKKCKLFSFALLATLLFAFNFGIVNAAPKSITVKRAEVLSDLITNHDHGFTIFTTTDGKILYCLDNLKPALLSGQTASDNGEADDGILYILRNGYPNKKITGNNEMDKYITQAAVWWYMDDTNQGSNKLSDEFRNATTTDINDLIPRIKSLVASAKTYKNSQEKPTISVSLDSNALALTSDSKYYESHPIKVNVTDASNYSAIFTGGTANTAIVNTNGTPATTFKAGESFKVRIPASELKEKTEINIKVTANGVEQVAKIYKNSDDKYQRVIGLYDESIPVSQSLKLVASPETTSIEVDVPNTSANVLMLSVAMGMLIIIAGVSLIVYRSKKLHHK